jgi:hypothetical protein
MTESIERPNGPDKVGDHLIEDQPLTSDVPGEEDVDKARAAEDLDQDPDTVPNRVQQAEPPRPERVGPWDDDDLED